jgi:hypothetical protein
LLCLISRAMILHVLLRTGDKPCSCLAYMYGFHCDPWWFCNDCTFLLFHLSIILSSKSWLEMHILWIFTSVNLGRHTLFLLLSCLLMYRLLQGRYQERRRKRWLTLSGHVITVPVIGWLLSYFFNAVVLGVSSADLNLEIRLLKRLDCPHILFIMKHVWVDLPRIAKVACS